MLKWEEVLYSPLVQVMQARLTLVSAGFPIRTLLQERGRLGQLEKMRTLLGRIRSSPRAEVPGHLRALLPEMKVPLSDTPFFLFLPWYALPFLLSGPVGGGGTASGGLPESAGRPAAGDSGRAGCPAALSHRLRRVCQPHGKDRQHPVRTLAHTHTNTLPSHVMSCHVMWVFRVVCPAWPLRAPRPPILRPCRRAAAARR